MRKTDSDLYKGLKKVNISENEWFIGKDSKVDGKKHQVIYGPGRKEYHLWGKDVDFVNTCDNYSGFANVNRHGNTSLNEKVKIYILTHILDEKTNWCFDLTKHTPEMIDKRIKVIYENGTVKWVESFDGEFKPVVIGSFSWSESGTKTVNPVAYRIFK